MKVIVTNMSPTPKTIIYENVVQIDYLHYGKTRYSDEWKLATFVQQNGVTKMKQQIDLTPDVQITILNDTEVKE